MKLSKSVYIDTKGNEWIIYKSSLPKKRGTFTFWIGECDKLSLSCREDKKKNVKKYIEKNLVK